MISDESHISEFPGLGEKMRKVILSMQVTLDCFIEGPNGEMDGLIYDDDEQWKDLLSNK
jgi:hypothetical protein